MSATNKKRENIFVMVVRLLKEGSTPVKLFFLFLSIFMWFLIKLSREGYDTVIEFPVKYQNLPANKTFQKMPPEKIRIYLKAGGFDILKYQFQSFTSVKVDVSRLERTAEGRQQSFWLTNSNLHFVEDQLGEGVEVRSISPDTVFFDFSRVIAKKVPVKLDIKKDYTHLKSIYGQPAIKPDSIVITGPEPKLRELDFVNTELLSLTAQQESLFVQLPLVLPKDPKLQFSHTRVAVGIQFTQMTQGNFKMPVEVINLPEQYDLRIFPEEVNLSYHVAVKDYSKVSPPDFRVYVNYNDIKDKPDSRYLNLAVESYPAFVNYVSTEPKRVEFILTEK